MSFLQVFWNAINRRRFLYALGTAICAGLVIFLSTYKLLESPPTWLDEGIIVQIPRNVATEGVYKIQSAPGTFVSAGFITTSIPVTLPIALSFKLFGTGLLQARMVMVLYLFILAFLVWYFTRNFASPHLAALFLIATFAPLYGNGKNVLGEIPGLAFMLASLICVQKIEKAPSRALWKVLTGLCAGLAFVTKPIFILALPAYAIGFFVLNRRGKAKLREGAWSLLAFVVPVIAWVLIHFSGDSLQTMVSIYANPHSTDPWISALTNFQRVFRESQPLYFAAALFVWILSVGRRIYSKKEIPAYELIAFIFSVLVSLAYLRTIGYYRYFFLGQFFAILFLTHALWTLSDRVVYRRAVLMGLGLLVLFQTHQTFFDSWVSQYVHSTKTAQMHEALHSIAGGVIVYQAPEIITFLPTNNYVQYMDVTETINVGRNEFEKAKTSGMPVVTNGEYTERLLKELPAGYKVTKQFDRYVILSK